MAAQLVAKGPLSILIDASTLQFVSVNCGTHFLFFFKKKKTLLICFKITRFYHKGVWNPKVCSQTETDHAIQLTGYGVDPTSNLPYWVVRNSWGTTWGIEGYFQMM